MMRLTYGQLPSKAAFDRHFDAVTGEDFEMQLRGSDARVAAEVGIDTEGVFDADQTYEMLEALVEAYENDENEEAGSLASSILQSLDIEWV